MSSPDAASQKPRKSQKPTYSKFNQQELPACKPILTPPLIIATWIFLGVTFIPLGLLHLYASNDVVQVIYRYDDVCIPDFFSTKYAKYTKRVAFIQDPKTDKTCTKTLTIPRKMKPPIYVYYEIDIFFQNHRRYVRSRNDEQYKYLSDNPTTKDCEPVATTVDRKPIVPCGLIAWSLFNDTYTIKRKDVTLPINKTNIAWKSDKEHKFGKNVYPQNFQMGPYIGGGKLNESIPLSEQEDLLVWMRPAAVPSFRKLYGRIETDLEANELLSVVIKNNYNTYTFGGRKKLILSTTSWIGGQHDFIGVVYMAVGAISILIAIIYILLYLIKPRPLGDPSYLSWNKNPSSTSE